MTAVPLLVLALAAAAEPSYSVAVTRRVGLGVPEGLELAETFAAALGEQRVESLGRPVTPRSFQVLLSAANNPDTAVCAGATDCASTLGRLGGVTWLVSLQVVKIGSELGLDASLLDVGAAKAVANVTGTMPARSPRAALEALARELSKKVPAAPSSPTPPAVAKEEPFLDGPKEPPPQSAASAPAGVAAVAPAPGRARRLAWIPAAGGGVLAATAGVFLLQAKAASSALRTEVGLSYDDAVAARERGKSQQTIGLVLGGAGLAALATAGVMVLLGGEPAGETTVRVGPGGVALAGTWP